MSNPSDSFIDEVTDEVRRDRLWLLFRRYGWILVALIVAAVGFAAWREYTRTAAEAEARQWGDAVLAAAAADDPAAALAAIDPLGSDGRAALGALLTGGALAEAGRPQEAQQAYETAAGGSDPLLRDLARLKAVLVAGDAMDPALRDATLAELSQPGAPFRLLALEQKVVALIGAGRTEPALTLIGEIQNEAGISEALRRRLTEMMIALGVDPAEAAERSEPMAGLAGQPAPGQ